MLPPPFTFGLSPDRYPDWYPGQEAALSWLLEGLLEESPKTPPMTPPTTPRFLALSAPTGSGKSVLAVLSGLLSGRRTLILTATKGLQDQYRDSVSFADSPTLIADIRGQNAYPCRILDYPTAEDGPCHLGFSCPVRDRGRCPYHNALSQARMTATQVVVSNYTCWLALSKYGSGLGDFNLLVCDEAHRAFDCLSDFLSVNIRNEELLPLGASIPEKDLDWSTWARGLLPRVDGLLSALRSDLNDRYRGGFSLSVRDTRSVRRLQSLLNKLERLATISTEWIATRRFDNFSLTPLWPGTQAEGSLFRSIPRVVLMSATLTPKALALLDVPPDAYSLYSMPSSFPPTSRPVIHVPTVRLDYRSTESDLALWAARIDQIIEQRPDKKGIVHTVSYARRDTFLHLSRNKDRLISHESASNLAEAVSNFRRTSSPMVLVSPSLSEGWDFPYSDCEYVVIGKVPYEDTREPVSRARAEHDPELPSYHAMQTIVQASGRAMRSASDRCEVIIIDDNWRWFYRRYHPFAPEWFQQAVVWNQTMPSPLAKVVKR